jgi:hypothetical protein
VTRLAQELLALPRSRTLGIALRTAHIAAMALFVGALCFAAPEGSLRVWRAVTVATGCALLATEVSHSRHWIYQGRGLMVLAHVAVLGAAVLSTTLGRSATLAALAIGSVGSHLPRSVRKWSFRHGRIVE